MFIKFLLSSVCLVPILTFAADSSVVIKQVPVTATSPASGPEMFKEYCATCHGVDAKGHGPAVPALKVPPPDLTLLSHNNQGKFPDRHVYSTIRGDVNVEVHGSKEMPVWGNVFRDMGTDAQSAERLANLCRYIKSLQQK